jgi:hypothetical protein
MTVKVCVLASSDSLCVGRLCSAVLWCCTAAANVEDVIKAYRCNESTGA